MFSKVIAVFLFLSVATAQDDAPAAVVVHPPTYSTAMTSQTVRMTCAAYGVPKPTITWSRNGGDLASKIADPDSGFTTYTKTVTVNGTGFAVAVLEICNIKVTDTDEYSCVADNGVVSGSAPIASPKATFFLSVTGAAPEPAAVVVRPPSDASSVYVGSTVEAVCVAYGNPMPFVSWSKENCDGLTCNVNTKVYDEVVTYGGISFRKSVMQLCNVSMANTGSYTCWAANGVGGDGVAPNSVMWDLSVKPQPASTSVSVAPPPTTTCPSYAIPSVAVRPTNTMESSTNATVERQVEELTVSENTYIGIIVVLAIVVLVLLIATIIAIIIAVKMRGSPQQKADIAHGQKHPQMIAVENPIHKDQAEEQLDEQEGDTMSYSDLAKKMEAEADGED